MGKLDQLEPRRVFHYFEEICGIPHGSGNVEQISNYLAAFAKEHGLFCIQDAMKNIIIVKPASEGYESQPAVILQGHMDMVAVKTKDCDRDLAKDALCVETDGKVVYARETSLGGDDGIAVAYALALLEEDSLKHPRLEVVITVDEEVGMDGAREIDLSMLTGKRMLNLDSEEEGIFLTSCAGGARVNCYLPVSVEEAAGRCFRISVEGLLGGHSGGEIHKERGNANVLMGRLLYRLTERLPLWIKNLEGGLADNAIPRRTEAEVLVGAEDTVLFQEILSTVEREIRTELASKDPDFQVTIEELGEQTALCADAESAAQLASCLMALPNGVQAMSADVPGLVETSLNLGIMQYDPAEQELVCSFSVRSCVESAKQHLIDRIASVMELAGGSYTVSGNYPGWAYRVDSPLRDRMVALYEEMYGVKPQLQAIHAGLECGILASKIKDLDCISFGPDMHDIHTTEETLDVASAARVWEFLVRLLALKE